MRLRRLISSVLMVMLLTATVAGIPASAQDRPEPGCTGCKAQPGSSKYVPGEILVRFREGVSKARAAQVMAAEGAKHVREIEPLEIHLLRLTPDQTVAEAVARFNKSPVVKYAEPN